MVVEAEVSGGDKHGAVEFENLPEECIAHVLSFTTPRDAIALSLVSSTCRSTSQSDVVWERFLPSDYRTIISRAKPPSDSLLCFASKKELFLDLCKPLLIDNGTKSFSLDKLSGKKCYMLSPCALASVWGNHPRYWRCSSETRFSEVAEIFGVCSLEVKGMKTSMLSPETKYAVYIVYKLKSGGSYGFSYKPVEVSVGIAGGDDPHNKRMVHFETPTFTSPYFRITPQCNRIFYFTRPRSYSLASNIGELQPPPAPARARTPVDLEVMHPKKRADGWLEIELGEFFNKGGAEDNDLEICLNDIKSGGEKCGIIVQGIEIRPKII